MKWFIFLFAVLGPQSLIRSGHVFCDEQHILVDFVRRAEPTIDGRVDMQPSSEVLRSVSGRGPDMLADVIGHLLFLFAERADFDGTIASLR